MQQEICVQTYLREDILYFRPRITKAADTGILLYKRRRRGQDRAVPALHLPNPVTLLLFSPSFPDHYDPDYEFLQQDLSSADQIPQPASGVLSPLPESLGESGSPFHARAFQLPEQHSSPSGQPPSPPPELPPALPEKKRRGTAGPAYEPPACRVLLERHPSQYDNLSEEDLHHASALLSSVPFTPFAAVLPFQPGNSLAPGEFLAEFAAPDLLGGSEKPPPLPEKKNKHSKCEERRRKGKRAVTLFWAGSGSMM